MKNVLVISRKRFLRSLQSESKTPSSNVSPSPAEKGSGFTSKTPLGAPVSALPLKRGRVIPLPSTALDASEYGDPADVLERRQFIGFGCGACQHHRRKPDLSAFHCDIGIGLWPEGTNKTCRRFSRRRKTDER